MNVVERLRSSVTRFKPALPGEIFCAGPTDQELVDLKYAAFAFEPSRVLSCRISMYGTPSCIVLRLGYQEQRSTYTQTICTELRWTLEFLMPVQLDAIQVEALAMQYNVVPVVDRPRGLELGLDGILTPYR